jgi:hypothetical protein
MLLRHSLDLEAEAAAIEKSVYTVVDRGVLPADIAPAGSKPATTVEAGQAVVAAL